MNNVDARIINLEKTTFVNKNTGEITGIMTKVTYMMKIDEFDGFIGKGIFEAYAKEKAFTELKKFAETNEQVKLNILCRPLKNGTKYILQSVNGIVIH